MAKLKIDLHDIYNKGGLIKSEMMRVIKEANDLRELYYIVRSLLAKKGRPLPGGSG